MENELNATETKKNFELMRGIFKRIVNNNRVNNLTHPLDFNTCHLNHIRKNIIYAKTGERPYDYLFIIDGKFYGLDISLDAEELGYDDEYVYQKYTELYDNLCCASLVQFNKDVTENDSNIRLSFIYDMKNKKIVEVLDLFKYSHLNNETLFKKGNQRLLKMIK